MKLPRASFLAFALAAASGRLADANRPAPDLAPRSPASPPSSPIEPRHGHHDASPQFSYQELFDLQKQFLDNFIAPGNAVQAESINSSLLAPNVQGRVDITRTFDGQELNTEYLFGLFANLASGSGGAEAFTLLGVPVGYEITQFAASGNVAVASTRFTFSFPSLSSLRLPVQIDTWNAFTPHRQIAQYDATFKWWPWTVATLFSTASSALSLSPAATLANITTSLSASVCQTASTYCNASNTPPQDLYANRGACEAFLGLGGKVRFGEAWELGRNTLLCRMVHQNMVPLRPGVHCAHVGPRGGGMCVDDKTYVQTVEEGYFTNYPFAVGGNLTGGVVGG